MGVGVVMSDVVVGLALVGCGVISSRGKSIWVGETFAPRLPLWLEVVTDIDEVAVVGSILTIYI